LHPGSQTLATSASQIAFRIVHNFQDNIPIINYLGPAARLASPHPDCHYSGLITWKSFSVHGNFFPHFPSLAAPPVIYIQAGTLA
jgi:hypothetical protein